VENYGKSGFGSGKRDKWEILSAIIIVTQQPSSFTRVMKEANLNYSTFEEYLRFMMRSNLVEKCNRAGDAQKRTSGYQATEKGNSFLELYCRGLVLLHGERFLENNNYLAEIYSKANHNHKYQEKIET